MLKLREIERKDLEIINGWRNKPELISYLGAPFRYINIEVDIKWFENYMVNRSNCVRCAVVDSEKDIILGMVTLASIDHHNQSAELHIMIGNESDCNKGIGTFAVKGMLNHAFNNLNLHRVYLTALENNARARHLYEKVGFSCDGLLRDATFKNGKFVNMAMYSILKNEFSSGGGSAHIIFCSAPLAVGGARRERN